MLMTSRFGEPARSIHACTLARSAGDPLDIEEAAKLLIDARSPMIIAGQGVLYAEASDELVALADLLDVPVMTTTGWQERLPRRPCARARLGWHRVYRPGCDHDLHDSDVIFATRHLSLTKHNITTLGPAARQAIYPRHQRCTRPEQGTTRAKSILGDAKLVLAQLSKWSKDRSGAARRAAPRRGPTIAEAQANAWWRSGKRSCGSTERPLCPYFVMSEFMRSHLDPGDAIVTHDSGSPRDQLLPFYVAKKPRGYIGWGKSHSARHRARPRHRRQGRRARQVLRQLHGRRRIRHDRARFRDRGAQPDPDDDDRAQQLDDGDRDRALTVSHERYGTRDIGGAYADLARSMGGWAKAAWRIPRSSTSNSRRQSEQPRSRAGCAARGHHVAGTVTVLVPVGTASKERGQVQIQASKRLTTYPSV